MRAIADVQSAFDVDADFFQHFDFGDKRGGIDHYSGADDGVLFGTQNAARNQLEHVAVFADDHGVAGIVAAGDARDVIERAGEIVDDLPFPSSPHCAPTTTTDFIRRLSSVTRHRKVRMRFGYLDSKIFRGKSRQQRYV